MDKGQTGCLRPEVAKYMTGPKPGVVSDEGGTINRVMQFPRTSFEESKNAGVLH